MEFDWKYIQMSFDSNISLVSLSARFTNNKHFERKIVNIFLPININICFECSKLSIHNMFCGGQWLKLKSFRLGINGLLVQDSLLAA